MLEWGFEVAVTGTALSFGDIVSGAAAQNREAYDALPLEEKLRDYERRCWVTIVAKFYGRVCLQSERLEKVPAVVLEHQRRHLLAEELQKRRAAALSPEERQQEFETAEGQLSRGIGFAAFSRR